MRPHLEMPRQPAVTEIRLNNIIDCLTPVLTVLGELNHAVAPAFVQIIANTTRALITAVQVMIVEDEPHCSSLNVPECEEE